MTLATAARQVCRDTIEPNSVCVTATAPTRVRCIPQCAHPSDFRSNAMYSQWEALSRDRMREQREHAANHRLVAQLAAARRWAWLADFSSRRADRSRSHAEHVPAEGYELIG